MKTDKKSDFKKKIIFLHVKILFKNSLIDFAQL